MHSTSLCVPTGQKNPHFSLKTFALLWFERNQDGGLIVRSSDNRGFGGGGYNGVGPPGEVFYSLSTLKKTSLSIDSQ